MRARAQLCTIHVRGKRQNGNVAKTVGGFSASSKCLPCKMNIRQKHGKPCETSSRTANRLRKAYVCNVTSPPAPNHAILINSIPTADQNAPACNGTPIQFMLSNVLESFVGKVSKFALHGLRSYLEYKLVYYTFYQFVYNLLIYYIPCVSYLHMPTARAC